ncbi:hypothetical protein QVD17_36729 [Tagetes erecta]|uniref:Uncharacterized protein n=1 Tax=Tagetes erecta TaxID=13708 RepID=A0AAD8NHL6_TARER|nr:hypothetical protein QVD17_36729 [Tagetes erecta]
MPRRHTYNYSHVLHFDNTTHNTLDNTGIDSDFPQLQTYTDSLDDAEQGDPVQDTLTIAKLSNRAASVSQTFLCQPVHCKKLSVFHMAKKLMDTNAQIRFLYQVIETY